MRIFAAAFQKRGGSGYSSGSGQQKKNLDGKKSEGEQGEAGDNGGSGSSNRSEPNDNRF